MKLLKDESYSSHKKIYEYLTVYYHMLMLIYRNRYVKGIYYSERYTIEEYGIYNNKFQELKEMKTFINKYELKIYLAITGIKFDNFKIYKDHSYARMINFYDE